MNQKNPFCVVGISSTCLNGWRCKKWRYDRRRAIFECLCNESSYITGSEIVIDGGYSAQ